MGSHFFFFTEGYGAHEGRSHTEEQIQKHNYNYRMSKFKLNYITRLFEKTSSKRIENYVITRLWHKLDNEEIKMILQQYVSRNKNNYALTDIYFPQFGIYVEVNEPAHYFSIEKINADNVRNQEIKERTSGEVIVIDCNCELSDIHKQIDALVDLINKKMNKQKEQNLFEPWNPDIEFSVSFWQNKGIIDVEKNVNFFTIDDICLLFGANPQKIKRGFLRKGAIEHPLNNQLVIWWPSLTQRSGWKNTFDNETGQLFESNIDSAKNTNHIKWGATTNQIRIVFLHHTDVLGFKSYKFCGVYKVDTNASIKENKLVWNRISKLFNLKMLTM